MRPEIRRVGRDLILLCRKAAGIKPSYAEVAKLDRELLKVAELHRLGAILGRGLSSNTVLSSSSRVQLASMKASAVGLDLEMGPHWLRVLGRLEDEVLAGRFRQPLVILKGAHLRRTVYRSKPYMRQMSDLDILVGDLDRSAVRSVLRSLGLSLGAARQPAFHRALQHDEPWFQRLPSGRHLKVDVHRGLMDTLRGAPSLDTLMQDSEVFPGFEGLRALSPVHSAVHCALHLATDDFSGSLRSLIDLDLLIQTQELRASDFAHDDRVVRRATGALFMAFTILDNFMKDVDDRYDSFQRGLKLTRSRRRVLKGLIDYERLVMGRTSPLEGIRKFMVQTATIQPWPHRLAYPCYQSAVLGFKAARGFYTKIVSP